MEDTLPQDFHSQDTLAKPVKRSKEFYDALVALGGSPEEVARHLGLSEAEVAGELAKARGRLPQTFGDDPGDEDVPGSPAGYGSTWLHRCRR